MKNAFSLSLLSCLLLAGVAEVRAAGPSVQSIGSVAPVIGAGAASAAAVRFTPPAGNKALREFADGMGKTPQERQELLQAITEAKRELFEQPYAAKGWKNNVAGAYAFFMVSMEVIRSDSAPDPAAQDRLFARLSETMAPDLAGVSDADKAELYDTLIANASLPLLLYIDAREKDSPAQVEHARRLAADYGRRLLKMEPAEVAALLQSSPGTGTAAAPSGSTGGANVDGRYECMMTQLSHHAGANFSVQYQPTGMWFVIRGNSYTTSGAGGSVQATQDVVSFRGGGYDGWRGARRGDAIVFRKNQGDPRPGEAVKVGDLRCGRRSG